MLLIFLRARNSSSSSKLNVKSALARWLVENTRYPFHKANDKSPGLPISVTDCKHANDRKSHIFTVFDVFVKTTAEKTMKNVSKVYQTV